jgi:hypothetical protein
MQVYDGGLYGNLLAVTNNNSKLCLSSCIMMVLVLGDKELPLDRNGSGTGDEPLGLFEHQHGL